MNIYIITWHKNGQVEVDGHGWKSKEEAVTYAHLEMLDMVASGKYQVHELEVVE